MQLVKIKIRSRFLILLAAFFIGFIAYGALSFSALNQLRVNGPLYQRIVQSKDLVADILPPPEFIIESYLVCIQLSESTDATEIKNYSEKLLGLKQDYNERHRFWQNAGLENALAQSLLTDAHQPAVEFYQILDSELIPAVKQQDKTAIQPALTKARKAFERHRSAIEQAVSIANQRIRDDESSAQIVIQNAIWQLGFFLLLAMGGGLFIAWIISQSIVKPLQEAVHIAKTVAAGDLRTEISVTGTDETSQLLLSLKEMNQSLINIVTQVRSGTFSIKDASSQIAAGNLDLSQRTENQAHALGVTASSMEELTSTVKHNADNAQQANQLAKQASEVASKGGSVVDQVVKTMGTINQSSHQIVDIISVIDGIAFQTNILALNAAVEAARAGEQGRGFAVVATEVRNLAQRSANAAKEIKTLINQSVENVALGSQLVDQAGSTMNDLVSRVSQVTQLIAEIANASSEQTKGLQQANSSLLEIDEATQQNAALVEQASAAAASLSEQSEQLGKLVSVFKLQTQS